MKIDYEFVRSLYEKIMKMQPENKKTWDFEFDGMKGWATIRFHENNNHIVHEINFMRGSDIVQIQNYPHEEYWLLFSLFLEANRYRVDRKNTVQKWTQKLIYQWTTVKEHYDRSI